MTDGPIKAGDKVMLVWGCCDNLRRHIGWVGTAGDIFTEEASCRHCGYSVNLTSSVWKCGAAIPLLWLCKMPDDGESKKIDQPEEVEA